MSNGLQIRKQFIHLPRLSVCRERNVSYQLLSLLEPVPAGFQFRTALSQEDVLRRPFALLAESREAAEMMLAPFGAPLAGIIVTHGPEHSWQQCATLLFHCTVPYELHDHLAPLLHAQLVLVDNCQQAENRNIEQTLKYLRAGEENLRNEHEFKLAKESLVEELAVRREMEELLESNNTFLNALLDAIPVPVFYKDQELRYLGINKTFEEFYGTTREKMIGKTVFDIAPKELADIYHAKDMELILDPGQQIYESQTRNAQHGDLRDVIFHKATFTDQNGDVRGMVGAILDITDRKRLEQEQLKNEKLESLGLLAGGIAHDFNNILTGIMGNISFAQMFLDATHKSHKPLVEAEKASVRATELARQLLTFARGGEPVKKVASLQLLLNETVTLVLHGSNVRGVVDIPASVHAIEADEGQICQVFHNIIINATQAMPGGGTLEVTARNETLSDSNALFIPAGNYVSITFSDQGCGISEDDLKRIFDPYFTTKLTGNGLGLASVHSIVSRHGGNIAARSVVGTGTTFTIHLPSTGEPFTQVQTGEDSHSAVDHTSGAILVMDDEEMIRVMSAEMLDYLGYQVTTCMNGSEAVELYATAGQSGAPFSAVIMDLTIPGGMGGKETAEQILEGDPKACLIVSSGYSNDPIMSDYRSYGFAGAVAKPYSIKEFSSLLGSVLAR